ncbi:MAG: choice-of-anchor D domain-containing protein [Acidobacteriia bacterium]|nr:choice-of-anchor D domain-containing protein [Terriglobia bacterium]
MKIIRIIAGIIAFSSLSIAQAPVQVVSPLEGPLRFTHSDVRDSTWEFLQHPGTGAHIVGGGYGAADDTNAWDINKYNPNSSSRDDDALAQVFAAADGDVVEWGGSGTAASCHAVLVAHPNSVNPQWWSGYLHLDTVVAFPGMHVTSQNLIGYLGKTCVNPDPNYHLHFVVYEGKNQVRGLISKTVGITERLCRDGSSEQFTVNGSFPSHPVGTFVQERGNAVVYLIRGPDEHRAAIHRDGIASPDVLRNPYNQTVALAHDQFDFKNVITISHEEMASYFMGGVISVPRSLLSNSHAHPDGTLIKRLMNNEISIVTDNGSRRPFGDAGTFLGLGYLFCNAIEVDDNEYFSYVPGSTVTGSPLDSFNLKVRSSNPDDGLGATVNPFDLIGRFQGTELNFIKNTTVNVAVPSQLGNNIFDHWLLDGVIHFSSFAKSTAVPVSAQAFTNITMDTNHILTAVYSSMPPVISGFSPTSASAGQFITVNGTNLLGVTSVLFNGIPAAIADSTGSTSLTVQVPENAQTGPITVVTVGGTTSSSSALIVNTPSIPFPTPATGGASWVGDRSAILNGIFNANFTSTSPYFEISTTPDFQVTNLYLLDAIGDGADHILSALANGLQPNTTYYFRAGAANARGNVRSVTDMFTTVLSGTPAFSVSTSGFNFQDLTLGQESAPQTINLFNSGTSALFFGGISMPGEFFTTQVPFNQIAPGTSFPLTVIFSPRHPGFQSGQIQLFDNTTASPHVLTVEGNAVGPAVQVSVPELQFEPTVIGTSSKSQQVSVFNTGNVAAQLQPVTSSAGFSLQGICPPTINPNSSCSFNVSFTPARTGLQSGGIEIHSNDPFNNFAVVGLLGNATNYQIRVQSTSSPTIHITAGQTGFFHLELQSISGYASPIQITCTGAPPGQICVASPSQLQPIADGIISFDVMVPTSPHATARTVNRTGKLGQLASVLLGTVVLAILIMGKPKHRIGISVLMVVALLAATISCAGGPTQQNSISANNGTPSGTYALIVTANDGHATRSLNLTLVVE